MKKTDLAWVAGIIDGEGCIHISRNRASTHTHATTLRHSLYLKVTMGHKPTVDRLHALFQLGSVQKATAARKKVWNAAFSWVCCGQSAAEVLRQCLPYLLTKAKEAEVALAFVALPKASRGGRGGTKETPVRLLRQRDRLCLKLRKLKPSYRFRPTPPSFREIMDA